MALVNIRNIRVLETDANNQTARLIVELDAPTTAPVTVSYYLQDESATDATSDYIDRERTVTIAAGDTSANIDLSVQAGTTVEGNETFSLILLAGQNAEFANGAAALRAQILLQDDDDGVSDLPSAQLGFATPIFGAPAESGVLPTLSVFDVSETEGDGDFLSSDMRFLVTLDRVATAPVTVRYYTEGVTASEGQGDYENKTGTVTIPAGRQAAYVEITKEEGSVVEPDETLNVIFVGAQNAVFAGGAAALRATGTIVNDDGVPPDADGLGGLAEEIAGPSTETVAGPTVRLYDTSAVEGDDMRFLVTLDRPATEAMTIAYSFDGASAVPGEVSGGPFGNNNSGLLLIQAGQQSAYIQAVARQDTDIEGDETFTVVLSNPTSGSFENGAAVLQATGTIISDDDGPITAEGGIGEIAAQVEGPVSTSGQTTLSIVDTSVSEGNSPFLTSDAHVYFLLSEPVTSTASFTITTINGSATEGSDYEGLSDTATLQVGQQSFVVPIEIMGDTSIEGDEQFTVRLSNADGIAFANGLSTMDATVLIRGDDGAGTSGTINEGPDFSYITPTPGATEGNDVLIGTGGADVLRGQGGNDRIEGGGGNDRLYGGAGADFLGGGGGADVMVGGTGNDFYIVDNTGDTISGEIAFSLGGGIDTVRTFINNYVQPDNIELLRLGNIDGTSNLNATGNDAPGTIVGNAGNNILTGRGGNDQLNGNNGNDRLIGNTGRDTLVGGNGNDTFVYTAYADSRAGSLNRDVINGFGRTAGQNDTIDLRQLDANTRTFGVNDAFEFIGGARFSGQAGELRTQALGGPNAVLIEADHNGDRVADLQIFVNLTTFMTESDFLL